MQIEHTKYASPMREENLADVLANLWRARFYLCTGLALGACLAGVFLILARPHTQASMVLAPARPLEEKNTGFSVEGYGQNAFTSSQDAVDQNFDRFQVVIKGAAVAGILLQDPEIQKGLAADRALRVSFGKKRWSPQELSEYIARRVVFSSVGETKLRRLTYFHADPSFAALFLNRLQWAADSVLRGATRKATQGRIAYLQNALAKTVNPDHRRALTDLLMEQERIKMLVSINQPYSADIVEAPFVSSRPLWPDASLVLSVGMILGAFSGFVYSLVRGRTGAQAHTDDIKTHIQKSIHRVRYWALRPENDDQKPLADRQGIFGHTDAAE